MQQVTAAPHGLCCLSCPTASAFHPKATGDAGLPAQHPVSGSTPRLPAHGTALLSCQDSPCQDFPLWEMFGAEGAPCFGRVVMGMMQG